MKRRLTAAQAWQRIAEQWFASPTRGTRYGLCNSIDCLYDDDSLDVDTWRTMNAALDAVFGGGSAGEFPYYPYFAPQGTERAARGMLALLLSYGALEAV